MDFLKFIELNLEKATEISLKSFGKVSSTIKGDDANQVLTETDLEIGKIIIESIKNNFPEHNIIDEETGVINNNSSYTWIIDPIDGTSNFAAGLPHFGNMISLLEKDHPLVAGISLPFFKEIYLAKVNEGAFCNGKRIKATQEIDLLKTLVAYGVDSHRKNPDKTRLETKILGELVLNIRNMRSSNSCFDEAMVARGKYGGVMYQTECIWDIVPGHLVLEEAGCRVTDFLGKEIEYVNHLSRVKENFTMCAAPPILHNKLQEIIHNVK